PVAIRIWERRGCRACRGGSRDALRDRRVHAASPSRACVDGAAITIVAVSIREAWRSDELPQRRRMVAGQRKKLSHVETYAIHHREHVAPRTWNVHAILFVDRDTQSARTYGYVSRNCAGDGIEYRNAVRPGIPWRREQIRQEAAAIG